ncbi:alpha/beta fold hydrolase [Devosia sp. J2-20]|uniref:alpha/beta fold hydrolase n=1 Tax=Devosia sp. J2-20 TaxID=3026161 RepID=UPI00249CDA52|nr:alpha/beta fold hydrolase [Devosia sp. J2-20]WDQ99654.1 alpha/beta fold hydrolase [Devosia sp. J2-20]
MTSALVLLPGLNCDERLWRDVISGLDAAVEPLVADYGAADSIAGMAASVLAKAPERFALAGLSMGGYVALEIMRQAPERVERLALLDTVAGADDDARKQTRRAGIEAAEQGKYGLVIRTMLAGLVAPQHLDTAIAADVLTMAEPTGAQAYIRHQHAIMGRIDSRPSLADIAVPTLVGVGALDMLTPPALAEEMAAAIAGAQLVLFAEAGHMSTMEAPEAVVAAMSGWMAR